MKVWTGFARLPEPILAQGTIVAIGNFDGLHLGHRKILHALVENGRRNSLFSLVFTFSPHPERVFGRRKIAMIQTLGQRLAGFREWGVQGVVVMPFDGEFASLSREDFCRQVIVSLLGAKWVVVGENFRFGRNRRGDIEALRRAGEKMGFTVRPIPPVLRQKKVVSSSLIRQLLRVGSVDRAADFLGRPYKIEGRVIRGVARGRSLGYPTANIQTENEIAPRGVFITEVETSRRSYPAVTNVGRRPTFGSEPVQIESFLLGFKGSLYGLKVKVRFLKKLRPERKFDSAGELSEQILRDAAAARAYFVR